MTGEWLKKYSLVFSFVISIAAGAFFATKSMAQVTAPALPDTTQVEQIGTDALSKLLNAAGSFQGIRSSLQSVESEVGHGTGFLNSVQKTWVDFNTWVENHIGVSLRTIIQYLGYIFIYIAVLWIKLIKWFLGII
jgi:hypothetical protein